MTRNAERVLLLGLGALASTAAQLLTRLVLNHSIEYREMR